MIPANVPDVDKSATRKLFASVVTLKMLYSDADKWNNEFLSAMSALFEEYKDVIVLWHIGYPTDWETILRK
ncbi:MAG: hypothetical protein LBS84_03735 [Clostridiales bacterium]|nr:hypothetical protein [Clostridiales bacterium]